jgi:hypothetical protein
LAVFKQSYVFLPGSNASLACEGVQGILAFCTREKEEEEGDRRTTKGGKEEDIVAGAVKFLIFVENVCLKHNMN